MTRAAKLLLTVCLLALPAGALAKSRSKKPVEPPPPPPPPAVPGPSAGELLSPKAATELAEGRWLLNSFARSIGPGSDGKPMVTSAALVTMSAGAKKDKETPPPIVHIRVDDCVAFYDTIRTAGVLRTTGSDSWPVTLEFGRMKNKDAVVLDGARGACLGGYEPLADPASVCASNGRCGTDFLVVQTELLSIVGPFVAWSTTNTTKLGKSPVQAGTGWTDWNLSTNKPAAIADVVDSESLLKALKDDSWVRQAIGDQLKSLATLDEMLATLDDHTEGPEDFRYFAFESYDVKKGKAKVELAFYRSWNPSGRNEPDHLVLTVLPRPEFRADFEAAEKGKGFFTETPKVDREIRGMTWTL
jgi:hypothetical protein